MPAADSGLLAAILLAGGVTVVVAIAMTIVSQHRAARLTRSRGLLSVTLGLSVMALVGLGIAAISPAPAQTVVVSSVTSTGSSSDVDVQLPTK